MLRPKNNPGVQVKKKGLHHLPTVADAPGQTKGMKPHWLNATPPRYLIDSPGLCPPPRCRLIPHRLPRHSFQL